MRRFGSDWKKCSPRSKRKEKVDTLCRALKALARKTSVVQSLYGQTKTRAGQ